MAAGKATDDNTRVLIERMGGSITPWPDDCAVGTPACEAFVKESVGGGTYFLLPGDGVGEVLAAPEARAVAHAGGRLYNALQVRCSLLRGVLEAPLSVSATKPPPRAPAAPGLRAQRSAA